MVHRFEHKVLPLVQAVRQAIELIVGHLKAGYEWGDCPKEEMGGRLHAVLCAAGYNLKWLLSMIA